VGNRISAPDDILVIERIVKVLEAGLAQGYTLRL
jgi:hypothetical protein